VPRRRKKKKGLHLIYANMVMKIWKKREFMGKGASPMSLLDENLDEENWQEIKKRKKEEKKKEEREPKREKQREKICCESREEKKGGKSSQARIGSSQVRRGAAAKERAEKAEATGNKIEIRRNLESAVKNKREQKKKEW